MNRDKDDYMWVELCFSDPEDPPDHLTDAEIAISCEMELEHTTKFAVQKFGPAVAEIVPHALFEAFRTYNLLSKTPWLAYRAMIVRRFAIDFIRREQKQKRLCKPETSEILPFIQASPQEDWSRAIQNVLTKAGQLTGSERWVFLLMTVGQFTLRETALILEVSPSIARKTKNDIRRSLTND